MDTIKNYLDNMFAAIPGTEEILQLKSDIYDNMCEKYQALKADGKSENEAIGIVISEFGNIDELIEEFGVVQETKSVEEDPRMEDIREITMEDANQYLQIKKKLGVLVGGGVFLCILGIVTMIGTSIFFESMASRIDTQMPTNLAGLISMFILIAIAVGLFVYGGMMEAPYEYIKQPFYMEAYARAELEERKKIFQPTYTISLIIAIVLCVLSPVPIFISQMVNENSDIVVGVGICLLLMMVAIASFMFIFFGNIYDAYQQLLEVGDYTPNKKDRKNVVEVVAAIIWPLTTAVYLYLGFFHNMWHPGWSIFPIVGVVFGIFSSIVEGVSKTNRS